MTDDYLTTVLEEADTVDLTHSFTNQLLSSTV